MRMPVSAERQVPLREKKFTAAGMADVIGNCSQIESKQMERAWR